MKFMIYDNNNNNKIKIVVTRKTSITAYYDSATQPHLEDSSIFLFFI
jgi:hypothetical protein